MNIYYYYQSQKLYEHIDAFPMLFSIFCESKSMPNSWVHQHLYMCLYANQLVQ